MQKKEYWVFLAKLIGHWNNHSSRFTQSTERSLYYSAEATPKNLHMQWWSKWSTHLLQNLQCMDLTPTWTSHIQHCFVGSCGSQLGCWDSFEFSPWLSCSRLFKSRGSDGSIFIVMYENPTTVAARPRNSIVQRIAISRGRMGNTTRRNSTTRSGRNIHVAIWAGVWGGESPFSRVRCIDSDIVWVRMCCDGLLAIVSIEIWKQVWFVPLSKPARNRGLKKRRLGNRNWTDRW